MNNTVNRAVLILLLAATLQIQLLMRILVWQMNTSKAVKSSKKDIMERDLNARKDIERQRHKLNKNLNTTSP